MTNLNKHYTTTVAAIILLFLLTGLVPYQQPQHVPFIAEAGELACIGYNDGGNSIVINCNSSFSDVVQTINDTEILSNLGNGEYMLNANLEVADGVSFAMTSNGDGLQYLKLAGENGIIVYGKILIDGVKITSWDIAEEDFIQQDMDGAVNRGYVRFAGSEGAQIINSEFGYLGASSAGGGGLARRGLDVVGMGDPSHDIVIRGSKFHDMWMAFYSNSAYNIVVTNNEYYDNILYALDPHTGTNNMSITNNWVHHNRFGIICSLNCYNILIEGNTVHHNTDYGIFFSRNMHDSIARNNHVYNSSIGITVAESPNNQIYNNTIEGAASHAIRLINPELADDGFTENNLVYNNTIINSENGIGVVRSQDNILENNTLSNIESGEYRLSGGSSLTIRGQHFDNAQISQYGSGPDSQIEIVDSGVIEVKGGVIDEGDGGEAVAGGDEEEEEEEEEEAEEFEGVSYNTGAEPYSSTLSNGDDITVDSS